MQFYHFTEQQSVWGVALQACCYLRSVVSYDNHEWFWADSLKTRFSSCTAFFNYGCQTLCTCGISDFCYMLLYFVTTGNRARPRDVRWLRECSPRLLCICWVFFLSSVAVPTVCLNKWRWGCTRVTWSPSRPGLSPNVPKSAPRCARTFCSHSPFSVSRPVTV